MSKLHANDLHDYQRQTINHVVRLPQSMLWLGLGLGKALEANEPVLTPGGWFPIRDLVVGDYVIGSNGKPVEVLGVYPQGEREIVSVKFKDGAEVLCDWDHLWTVQSDRQRTRKMPSYTITTRQIFDEGVSERNGNSMKLKWAIPLVTAVEFDTKTFPIDPYTMGVFLGDGYISSVTSENTSPTICTDLEIINNIGKLTRMHESSSYTAYGRLPNTRPSLFKMGLVGKRSWEKFVPEEYLFGDKHQRLAILQGLLDTDGSAGADGGVEFSSTSENLIDSVVDLAQSLGGIGRKSKPRVTKHQNGNGRTSWRVNVKLPTEMNPFRLSRKLTKWKRPSKYHVIRKIESITPHSSSQAVCIRVNADDHLFVTKGYIVTHNTISSLTAFDFLRQSGQARSMLVVAPLRVCELTWRQEAENWSHTKHLTFSIMCGSAKKRQRGLFRKADIYLVNYESLTWLATQLEHYFIDQGKPLPFDMIVFDEVSKVKRSVSKRFEAFAPIVKHIPRRVGLTASPCSNGMHDLWAQFFMLDDGDRLGTSYSTFQSAFFYQKGKGDYGKWEPYADTRNMITNRIKDITVEMSAEDHLDMPPFSVIDVPINLPPKKLKAYKELETNFFMELDSGGELEVFNKAALSSKLLQFSGGILYNYPDEQDPDYQVEEFIHDEKYKALAEIIEGSGDDPILLAYQFKSERNEILKRYPEAESMTGVKESEAIDIMTRFNAGEIKLLVGHGLSLGHGLNLQKACHTLVWFGLSYNLEIYEQFNGRINRQGQTNPVQCFRIVCVDTMDYAVMDALEHKDETQSAVRDAINRYRNK